MREWLKAGDVSWNWREAEGRSDFQQRIVLAEVIINQELCSGSLL